LLPKGSRELFVRVRIDNATKEDTAVYWWSNMAVDEKEEVRVIVPAKKAFRYSSGEKLKKIPIPYEKRAVENLQGEAAKQAKKKGGFLEMDISKSTTLYQSTDFFFDVEEQTRPFIAAIDKQGYGMCQTSTQELRGRKLFVWGMGEGGRNWQRFLAKEGCAYIELQSGLAKTQLEHLPMKGGASISWLESYGALQGDPQKIHGENWDVAVEEVENALEKARPNKTIEKWHQQLKKELDNQNGPVIHRGMGFAKVEKALLKEAFQTAGLTLEGMRIGVQENPWWILAKTGALPCPDPLKEPTSYQIEKHWEKALQEAIQSKKSDHWFARYQLGVVYAAQGENKIARKEFLHSIDHVVNPWALRCLGVLEMREGNMDLYANYLQQAAKMKPIPPLIIETLEALAKTEQYDEILALISTLPLRIKTLERVRVSKILALIRTKQFSLAQSLLEEPFALADIREGDRMLTDLWFELQAYLRYGNKEEKTMKKVHEQLTPPKHLDFRMS
ncbi:MAG: DUF5107 domain-containing protein, partial [Clostridiales bacterium]|nr:DUF5107 domain-containing protein [Clostridiales bacterium]